MSADRCEAVISPATYDPPEPPEKCGADATTEDGYGTPLCAEHEHMDGRGWA